MFGSSKQPPFVWAVHKFHVAAADVVVAVASAVVASEKVLIKLPLVYKLNLGHYRCENISVAAHSSITRSHAIN